MAVAPAESHSTDRESNRSLTQTVGSIRDRAGSTGVATRARKRQRARSRGQSSSLREHYASEFEFMQFYLDGLLSFARHQGRKEREKYGTDTYRAQAAGAVRNLVVIGATLVIGVLVIGSIFDAVPSTDHEGLSSAEDQVMDTVAASFELGAVLPIVVIASALLMYLGAFGGNSTGARR